MNKILKIAKDFWTTSIRRQLMLGIILVHALLMTIFVYDLVKRQGDFLHAQGVEQANSLSETLAANSTSWILSNDVIGLEEVLQSQINYPDLQYAMVLGSDGRVLGHTDVTKTGLYISDEISKSLLISEYEQTTLVDTVNLIDVASPIFSNGEPIGWARVGLGQERVVSGLKIITRDGLVYTLIAIFIGTLFAFLMARGITKGLQQIVAVAYGVNQGDLHMRSTLERKDELGHLSDGLNMMLDTIENNKRDMQAISDHSPALIYAKDINGRYTFVNHKWATLFGKEYHNIIGKNDFEIFPEEFAKKFTENDKEVLTAGREVESEEVAPHADGVHTYATVKFPLENEKGDIYAVCGISTDITLRIQQEKNLRHIQKMDALGKLTGGIAHDYNNMLAIILGYTELLAGLCDGNPDAVKYLKTIQHAGERGSKLTKKLLSFSKDTSGDESVVYINSLLQEQSHMLEKVLTARIKLIFNLESDLWPIWIDTSEFEDAIINMCINAMHAMEGDGQLTIKANNIVLRSQDASLLDLKQGEYIEMSITDTGKGISDDIIEKIFDPFFSTKGEQGTGLGLSQIYGLVENSGGAIKVDSKLGEGTKFSLYFPRYMAAENKEL